MGDQRLVARVATGDDRSPDRHGLEQRAAHRFAARGVDDHVGLVHRGEQAIARQPYAPEFATYLLTQLRVPAARIGTAGRLHRSE